MIFSELPFFAFFLVYLIFHFIVPTRYRIYLIIAGSTFFYAWWRVTDVWVPFALAIVAWCGVRWFEATDNRSGAGDGA